MQRGMSGRLLVDDLSGRGCLEKQDGCWTEQVLPLELHIRRNTSTCDPIEDSLRSPGAVPKSAGKLRGAAEPFDDGCVVHGTLNTTFIDEVNTVYINKVFSAGTIAHMDPSYTRLMAAAQKATQKAKDAIQRPADLARHMNESPQRIHNWQARGVSKEGALKAEVLYGVSATYILEGTELRTGTPGGPPLPPPDFSDRREVTDTDWGLLQDVRLVMSDQELNELRERAERTRRIAQTQLEGFSAGAAPRTPRPSERVVLDELSPGKGSPRKHSK